MASHGYSLLFQLTVRPTAPSSALLPLRQVFENLKRGLLHEVWVVLIWTQVTFVKALNDMEGSAASSEKKADFFDAESYVNTPDIELAWADKAVEHMETHYNLITSVPPKLLKLTPYDDEIYSAFTSQFPDFKLDTLEIESLKSEESKKCYVFSF
ncbi:unnamed protein product [Larinioides sclopetarius]|uniref:Polysaccharide biosynthesis domain-containing protein n=1 Tax=Larinioides sclopetarius TaxID=280406 RepID=A0AAV2AAB1_9ARAC